MWGVGPAQEARPRCESHPGKGYLPAASQSGVIGFTSVGSPILSLSEPSLVSALPAAREPEAVETAVYRLGERVEMGRPPNERGAETRVRVRVRVNMLRVDRVCGCGEESE